MSRHLTALSGVLFVFQDFPHGGPISQRRTGKYEQAKELARRLSGGTIYVKIPDQFRPGTIGTMRRRKTLSTSATNTGGNHAEVCYCACGGDHGRLAPRTFRPQLVGKL